MKYIETEGKNVEQAIELGLYKLGLERDQVSIQIIDQGGLFSKAKVKISTEKQSEEEKEIQDFFNDLIANMGISCYASVEEKNDNSFLVNLTGNDVGTMIGKRGDILSAIQYVSSQILNIGKDKYRKIIVDSSNYLSRREESLKILARNSANKAIKSGKPIKLNFMNSKERRIIHTELAENEKVKTESKGTEPKRYIVITPITKKNEKETNYGFNVSLRDNND